MTVQENHSETFSESSALVDPDYRLVASAFFLLLAAAVVAFEGAPTPQGPWEGIYRSYPIFWGLLLLSVAILVVGSRRMPQSLVILAVGGAAVATTLPTLTWGLPFGLRDPWIHLFYLDSGLFIERTPYPLFYSTIDTVATTLGTDSQTVLGKMQIVAPVIGIAWLAALVGRIDSSTSRNTALVGLSPVVVFGMLSRPFSLAPLWIVFLWWALLVRHGQATRMRVGILLAAVSILWHPLVAVIVVFIVGLWYLVSLAPLPEMKRRVGLDSRTMTPLFGALLLFGVGFVYHLLAITDLGPRIFISLLVEFSSAGGSVSASASQSTPLIFRIPNKLIEVVRRSSIVILLGVASAIGAWYELRERALSYPLTISMLAAGATFAVFIIADLTLKSGFVKRGIVVAAVVLLPAAIIGLQRSRWAVTVLLALCLVLSGGTLLYGSPMTGTIERTTTQGDVHGAAWMADHRGNGLVVGSENTYAITKAHYDRETAREWAGGPTLGYQDNRRPEDYSWQVRSNGDTYYAVTETARQKASGSKAGEALSQFAAEQQHIYENGNMDWYLNLD